MATINNIKKRAAEIKNAYEPESVTAEKVGQLFEDIADVTEQTITSSEEVMQESVRAATQAAQAAEDASGYLADLQEAIADLPDGQAVTAEVAVNKTDIAGLKSKTDSISKQNTESEEQEIIYETDGGVQVGKIDANGADFVNLKRGGQQVARMSDLPTVPTLDTSISSSPSNSHTPSTKAVKDYVDEKAPSYPISLDGTTPVDSDRIVFEDDNGNEVAEVNATDGVKAKKILYKSGNEYHDVAQLEDHIVPQIKKKASETSITTELIIGDDNYNPSNPNDDNVLVRIDSDGLHAKNITDLNGNPIGNEIDYTDIVASYAVKYSKTIDDLRRNADFNALFFSDIHGRSSELQRIVQFGDAMKDYLDCIIDGGDDTETYTNAKPPTWADSIIADGELPCLRAVGNHDAWPVTSWEWNTNQNIYNLITSKVVTDLTNKNVSIHQPSDVATTYKNYYYVDFGNVRVIVLISMSGEHYWDSSQSSWFEGVLADALTNDKHVLVVNHAPLSPDAIKESESWPNWNSHRSWEGYSTGREPHVNDAMHLASAAITIVDSFISDGGHFIAYIAGHTHTDYVLETKEAVNKQFCVVTSCARANPSDSYTPSLGALEYDLFNWISIDTSKQIFKMLRLGNGQTYTMNEHSIIVIDYRNARILTSK